MSWRTHNALTEGTGGLLAVEIQHEVGGWGEERRVAVQDRLVDGVLGDQGLADKGSRVGSLPEELTVLDVSPD